MPANLAGLPALALPVPGGPAGLPASLQLIGPPGSEEQLIWLGHVIEAALRLRRLAGTDECPAKQEQTALATRRHAVWNGGKGIEVRHVV